ncbi:hypothetical protein CVT24_005328 [Panaeolus cyanescens]|uniref:Ribonuclease H n=1 Tax=Panaeolus cyanescens TaxID=181874 RepID=A0A409Y990_9AGAR|nr:hypothetical protein CVT24_005328 [Panaeolus cyanescens]
MPKAAYYAVQRGRSTGIYDSWDDCEAQVKGFLGAKYKKFLNRAEAEAFVAGGGPAAPSAAPSTSVAASKNLQATKTPDEDDESGFIVVYTDGACKGNGKNGSVAGVGVWWGPNDPRNIAERCPGDQTNNRAELIAILRMLEETPITPKPLLVKSDSQYSIKCLTEWISKWQSNGFRLADGSPIKNAGIIRCIWSLLGIREASGQKVRFKYVKGHSGHVGNDGADDMANRGALLPILQERDWETEERQLQQQLEALQKKRTRTSFFQANTTTTSKPVTLEPASIASTSKPSSPTKPLTLTPKMQHDIPDTRKPFTPSMHQSPLKVIYAGPPLIPVNPRDVNFDDYADCLLDDEDLANELSD